jgi:hypothetical protein
VPFTYERDDAARRVLVTLKGAFDAAEVLKILDHHRAENVPAYGLIYDGRELVGEPKMEDVRAILSERLTSELGTGPVAFVVTAPNFYRMACTYVALASVTRVKMEVFRDILEAEAWMAKRTPLART